MTGHASILLHLHEVEGAVEATGQLGYVHVEGELPVKQCQILKKLEQLFILIDKL